MRYAVIFGAMSYEHEISIVSAITLKKLLKDETQFIFCDKDREFYHIDPADLKADYFSSENYKKSDPLALKRGGFYKKGLLKEKKVEFDKAINLIHGKDGEDGVMASLLEFFNIEYIGPRVEASVISYNKELTKLYAKSKNVKTLPYEVLHKDRAKVINFEYPIIIKPLRLGSSIGISVVKDEKDLEYALDVAFEFDDDVLVEPFFENIKEYNIAGIKSKDGFIFSSIEEPQKIGLLDFDKKYLDFSRSESISKAEISKDKSDKIKECFSEIYTTVFEGAIVRCDFFEKEGEIYLNEINPIPGSLANYLFDDFESILNNISKNLPKKRQIHIDYKYINHIKSTKK